MIGEITNDRSSVNQQDSLVAGFEAPPELIVIRDDAMSASKRINSRKKVSFAQRGGLAGRDCAAVSE